MKKNILIFLLLITSMRARATEIFVPSQYPTVQQAINAAPISGAVIYVNPGTYIEKLLITNKSMTIIGNSQVINGSVVYPLIRVDDSDNWTRTPTGVGWVIEIRGTGSQRIVLRNINVKGGTVNNAGYFIGGTRGGIFISNANVTLETIDIDGSFPWNHDFPGEAIHVQNSVLSINNMQLMNFWGSQIDRGITISNSNVSINNLVSINNKIDHTIDIENNYVSDYSNVSVSNSSIRASGLHYGECIRTYGHATLNVNNCKLFRAPGEEPWDPSSAFHAGIGVNGPNNSITIDRTWIVGLPIGINIGPAVNSDIKVQNSVIENSENYAVMIENASSGQPGNIDLGGGTLGSVGNNFFIDQTPNYHIYIANQYGRISTATLNAKQNYWSYASNLAPLIYDFADDHDLIRMDYGTVQNATSVPLFNAAPFFVLSSSERVINEDAVSQVIEKIAVNINDGNPNRLQTLTFQVSNDHPELFSEQPTIDASGTLRFTAAPDKNGTARLTIRLQNSGSNTPPNLNISAPQYFTIHILPLPDRPVSANHTVSLFEDATYTFTLDDFYYYDGDNDDLVEVILSNAQFFKNNGVPITSSNNRLSPQDIAAGHLTYHYSTPNYFGPGHLFQFAMSNDGDYPSVSQQYTMSTQIIPVNDKPQIINTGAQTMDYPAGYGEIRIAPSATIIDPDSPSAILSMLRVYSPGGYQAGESLQLSIPAGSGIEVFVNTGLNLVLNGNSTSANYANVLQSLRYVNTNVQTCSQRTLNIIVKDHLEFGDALVKTLNLIPSVSNNTIQESSSDHCSPVDLGTIIGSTPTGGNGTYTYQWQSSLNTIGPWINIPGANDKDYDPPIVSESIHYQRIVNSGSCTGSVLSNIVSFVLYPVPPAQSIYASGSTDICMGYGLVKLSVSEIPEASYQWLRNNIPISSATSESYSVSGNSKGGIYRVDITNGCATVSSNSVPVNIMECSDSGDDKGARKMVDNSQASELMKEETHASIHPNPFTNKFNITVGDLQNACILIKDMTGKTIWEGEHKNITVETGEWASGVYYAFINESQNRKVLRLVKL